MDELQKFLLKYSGKKADDTNGEEQTDEILKHVFGVTVKTKDSKKRQATFVITSEVIDRHGDIVKVNGADLGNFEKNPVVLYGHNYSGLPVGKVINTKVNATTIEQTVEFATEKMNPLAENVWLLVEGGFLKTVSIGFIPKKAAWDQELLAYTIDKWELLKLSIVPVPANQESLKKGLEEENKEVIQKDAPKEEIKEDDTDEVVEEEKKDEQKEVLRKYRKLQVKLRSVLGVEATENELETIENVFSKAIAVLDFVKEQVKYVKVEEEEEVIDEEEEVLKNLFAIQKDDNKDLETNENQSSEVSEEKALLEALMN